MNKIIYTAGYGNRKPDEFVKLLKDAGVTVVLDVRRKGSKSWCGKYHQGGFMRIWLYGKGVGYWPLATFGNKWDRLDAYEEWLGSRNGMEEVGLLAAIIEDDYLGERLCLLCAEGDAYKYDPEKWKARGPVNCHRVHVADALVSELGDGWEVVHL